MRRLAFLVLIVSSAGRLAEAHPAPFSYLDLRFEPAGAHGSLMVHDWDVAHDLGLPSPDVLQDPSVAAAQRDRLVGLLDSRLQLVVDGERAILEWLTLESLPDRDSLRLTFRLPSTLKGTVRIQASLFPYDPIHQTFVTIYEDGALRQQGILSGERLALDHYAGSAQGVRAVVGVFVPAGIEHILIGPDHVLFVIGLLLLGGSLWRLTAIVTAFTLGHSVTLSLAALDLVAPPAHIVEPAIALSIVFVGADNLLVQRGRRGAAAAVAAAEPRDIRAWIAGAFGLVHGFGFASVLRDFGLPQGALGWSLFSFNMGVEIGQLAIVLVAATALSAVRRRDADAGDRLAVAGSIVVIAAGTYWFVERIVAG